MIPFRARFKDMQISKSFLRIFSFSVYQGTYIAFFCQDDINFVPNFMIWKVSISPPALPWPTSSTSLSISFPICEMNTYLQPHWGFATR